MTCGRNFVAKALRFVERRDEDKERGEEKEGQWRNSRTLQITLDVKSHSMHVYM